uniref:Uncharacterized protein n=1 Tax=Schistocephalus solidus TaxID=70667 RepID=A0A0V0J4Y4_SCHSO
MSMRDSLQRRIWSAKPVLFASDGDRMSRVQYLPPSLANYIESVFELTSTWWAGSRSATLASRGEPRRTCINHPSRLSSMTCVMLVIPSILLICVSSISRQSCCQVDLAKHTPSP